MRESIASLRWRAFRHVGVSAFLSVVSLCLVHDAGAGLSGEGTGGSQRATDVTLSLEDLLRLADEADHQGQLPLGQQHSDPQVIFWMTVLSKAEGHSPALANAARERIRKLVGWDFDLSTFRLLSGETGQATMPDGVNIDWSQGAPTAAPRPKAEVRLEGREGKVRAGEPIKLTVTVTNTGKGTLYQLRGVASSPKLGIDKLQVLFGKIEPGRSVTRQVSLEMPATLGTTEVTVTLNFQESNGYTPESLVSRAQVTASGRPVLAMTFRVIDDGSGGSVGNGDGVVQRAEALDLKFEVMNTGDAPAVDTELKLNVTGREVKIFGQTLQQLGTLKPGEVKSASINVAVQQAYADAKIPITATLTERGPFQVSFKKDLTLTIDEKPPIKVIALDRPVYVSETAALLNGASEDARTLGRVEKGVQLHATGELNGYVQVQYQSSLGKKEYAWLPQRVASFSPLGGGGVTPQPARMVVSEFRNAPPLVAFLNPAETDKVETEEEDYGIRAIVKDDQGLAKVVLRVNGEIVAQNDELGLPQRKGSQAMEPAKDKITVSRRIKLQDGSNRVSVEAEDTGGEIQRVEVVISRIGRGVVDVSVPPSARGAINRNAYAVVIGVESYRDLLTPAVFAKSDAESMKNYLIQAMGYPAENVQVLLNDRATRSDVVTTLESWLPSHVDKDSQVFVYFSGHGAPEGASGETFLLPYDGRPDHLKTSAYSLDHLYESLNKLPTDRILVVLDSCFSGQGERSVFSTKLKSVVRVTPPRRTKGILFSASTADQTSVVYHEGKHGLFTYYFLKGLRGAADSNKDRTVDIVELFDYVKKEVPSIARKINGDTNQTPSLDPVRDQLGSAGSMKLIQLAE